MADTYVLYIIGGLILLWLLFGSRKSVSSFLGMAAFKPPGRSTKGGVSIKTNFTVPEPPVIQFGLDTIYQPGSKKKNSIQD